MPAKSVCHGIALCPLSKFTPLYIDTFQQGVYWELMCVMLSNHVFNKSGIMVSFNSEYLSPQPSAHLWDMALQVFKGPGVSSKLNIDECLSEDADVSQSKCLMVTLTWLFWHNTCAWVIICVYLPGLFVLIITAYNSFKWLGGWWWILEVLLRKVLSGKEAAC